MGTAFQVGAIASDQRRMVQLSAKITGASGVLSGTSANHLSIVKNGTGDYTVTIGSGIGAYGRLPEVMVVSKTDNTYARVSAVTSTTVRILGKTLANSAADIDLDLLIVGSQSVDPSY